MAYLLMAYIIMAHAGMALCSYGLYSLPLLAPLSLDVLAPVLLLVRVAPLRAGAVRPVEPESSGAILVMAY